MIKQALIYLFFLLLPFSVQALTVRHEMQTAIGGFDVSEESFTYEFTNGKNYDVKTSLKTVGAFDSLYPFYANYHSFGKLEADIFKPQDYFYETQTRFKHRTKRIVYRDGVPQYRISTKGEKKRQDEIEVDKKYKTSNDLLSTFAELVWHIIKTENCDFEQYSFDGKRYSRSNVRTLPAEDLITPYFKGYAMKCRYSLEVLDEAEAGFFVNKDEPIYFWALRDKKTNAWFLARVLIESTPFGKMETITTKIEVIP